MAILQKHNTLVNKAIESMGIDPAVCADQNTANVWKLHRGDAQIIVVLQDSKIFKENTIPTITIMSPILQAVEDPTERLKLYQYILETNHKLTTETFSVSNNWVILSATYYIENMTQQEIRLMLDSLSFQAQQFLDNLNAE